MKNKSVVASDRRHFHGFGQEAAFYERPVISILAGRRKQAFVPVS